MTWPNVAAEFRSVDNASFLNQPLLHLSFLRGGRAPITLLAQVFIVTAKYDFIPPAFLSRLRHG
jgi:hypothetical protein